MSLAKVPFGLRDGVYWHALEVENGLACGCVCPSCLGALIAANQGEIQIAHFRHATPTECVESYWESVFFAVQQVFKRAGHVTLPGYETRVSRSGWGNIVARNYQAVPVKVVGEFRLNEPMPRSEFSADVLLQTSDNRRLAISLVPPPRRKPPTALQFERMDLAAIELNLRQLAKEAFRTPEAFAEAVLDDVTNKSWLYSQRIEKAIADLEAQCQQELVSRHKKQIEDYERAALRRKQELEARPLSPSNAFLTQPSPLIEVNAQQRADLKDRVEARVTELVNNIRELAEKGCAIAYRCADCYFAEGDDFDVCPRCASMGTTEAISLSKSYLQTVEHRLRCSVGPGRSLERLPDLSPSR